MYRSVQSSSPRISYYYCIVIVLRNVQAQVLYKLSCSYCVSLNLISVISISKWINIFIFYFFILRWFKGDHLYVLMRYFDFQNSLTIQYFLLSIYANFRHRKWTKALLDRITFKLFKWINYFELLTTEGLNTCSCRHD